MPNPICDNASDKTNHAPMSRAVLASKQLIKRTPAERLLNRRFSWNVIHAIVPLLPRAALDEARWTPPSARCPHPERWRSFDIQSTEIEVTALVGAFVRAVQPDYVVETGTASAQTAIAIGRALKRNGHGSLVTLEIDPHRVAGARRLCGGLPVEVREQASMEFTPDRQVDFAWFDSLLDLRTAEFRRYYPQMHDRTVVGFHDTAEHHGVLQEQIDQLAAEGLLRCIQLPTPRGVTFAQVLSLNPPHN